MFSVTFIKVLKVLFIKFFAKGYFSYFYCINICEIFKKKLKKAKSKKICPAIKYLMASCEFICFKNTKKGVVCVY